MRPLRRFTFAVWAALLLACPAHAQDEEKRVQLTPFVGWTRFDRERRFASGQDLVDGLDLGGRLGLRLAGPLWLEVAGGRTRTTDSLSRVETWDHLSGNLMLSPTAPHLLRPFISAGAGASRFTNALGATENAFNLEAAGGLRLRLSDAIGIRLEARNVLWIPRDHWSRAHIDDLIFGAGLSLALGGGGDNDRDSDGVPDRRDKCPGTVLGCKVDRSGCPVDSDHDGVCDELDRCPNSPPGAVVDERGCTHDADSDGVPDGVDSCAMTPKGCTVDAHGCPADADSDGVCDGVDACPNTSPGCAVDAKGCPTDADHDGVCDRLDKCADTPAGSQVGPDGCPLTEGQLREKELLDTGRIRLQDVRFASGKATILPELRHTLDLVGAVLSKWPRLQIEVAGHTDARGATAYNQALSQRRAVSVRAYLLAHFPKLRPRQLIAKGYGESRPVAPNTSPAAMALNRRVDFTVLNPDALRQPKH